MPIKYHALVLSVICLVTLLGDVTAQDQRAFLWTASTGMEDLGTLGGNNSVAIGISTHGKWVVGTSDVSKLFVHAFLWDAANGMRDLGVLGQGYIGSQALDVNDAGQVVGFSDDISGNSTAFIWTHANGMQPLPSLGGAGGQAWGINRSGQVTGWTTDTSGHTRAFLWTLKNGIQDLGTLGGGIAWASDINDDGNVVGYSSVKGGAIHVFIWNAATGMQDLGTIGHFCFPFAMNNADTLVGSCQGPYSQPVYGSLDPPKLKKLSLNGATGGRGDGINNANQAVGYLQYADGKHAVMWDHGQIIDMGSLGGEAEAEDISDRQEVVGYSYLSH